MNAPASRCRAVFSFSRPWLSGTGGDHVTRSPRQAFRWITQRGAALRISGAARIESPPQSLACGPERPAFVPTGRATRGGVMDGHLGKGSNSNKASGERVRGTGADPA